MSLFYPTHAQSLFDRFASYDQNAHKPIDTWTEEDKYVLALDVPALDRDSLDVAVENNVLRFSGSAIRRGKDREAKIDFRYQYSLPDDSDVDQVQATYKDGRLEISVPRAQAAQEQKDIEVRFE